MKKLRFILGFLTAMMLALTPAVSPVGPLVGDARANPECTPSESTFEGDGTNGGTDGVWYKVLHFTSTGTCSWSIPAGVSSVDYLIVGGGGAGGGGPSNVHGGGGGGGGGVRPGAKTISASSVDVTVGQGASGNNSSGTAGGSSSFDALSVGGGGGGGSYYSGPTSGATGGGAGHANGGSSGKAGDGTYGFGGGSTSGEGWGRYYAGGGGGADEAGLGEATGRGGNGKSSSITGTSVLYGGGGGAGGGELATTRSVAGLGGGGAGGLGRYPNGSSADSSGLPGTDGLGGGGGGGAGWKNTSSGQQASGSGGSGGDGVVIVRYSLKPDNPTGLAISSGDGQAIVTYTAPDHAGAEIADYEWQYRTYSSSAWGNWSGWQSLGDTDGLSSISLTNGDLYDINLRTVNSAGYRSPGVNVGTVLPSPVGEILRLDATHPDSYGGSGTTWADLAGSLDGTLTNGPTYSAREKAFQFDGTNDYVDLPDISYDFSNGLAVHVVADFGDVDTWERLIDFGQGSNDLDIFFSRIWTTNDFGLDISNSSRIGYCRTIDGDGIQPGMHTYSAVVSASGGCSLYRDGVQLDAYVTNDANPTVSPTPSRAETATTFLPDSVARTSNFVGFSNWSADDDFNGKIQSVVVYNTAQTTPTCYPVESTFTGDGTIGEDGVAYKVLEFVNPGECEWTVPTGVSVVDYLLVAGGGGGAGRIGGGGGAGGLLAGTGKSVTAGATLSLVVGVGGSGGLGNYAGSGGVGVDGGDSSALGFTASGGGGGGGTNGGDGLAGGSGGGGGRADGAGGLGTAGQGNAGGAAFLQDGSGTSRSGGGGGAGGQGASGAVSGNGGIGLQSSITGTSVYYAGGGGGSAFRGGLSAGLGGSGGGGDASLTGAGTNGAAGTGGGGGGGAQYPEGTTNHAGGDGGSGVIVLRYATAVPVTFDANGGTGSMATQSVSVGTATNLTTNSFSRTGYTFAGWDTVAGGGGTDYTDAESVTLSSSLTLYAQWNVDSYTVTWNSNSGSAVSDSSVEYGADLTAPTPPTRTGYAFRGWAATDGGTAVTFPYSHPNTADFTMYALWEQLSYEATADTFLNTGSGLNTSRGASTWIGLKNAEDSTTNDTNRIGLVKFVYDADYDWEGARFELTVSGNNDGGSSLWNSRYTAFNVNVYGVSDASWSETVTFSDADSTTAGWGVDRSDWPWTPNSAEFLGTISIPTSVATVGETYSLSTAELDQFLNDDVDGEVSLWFARSDTDRSANLTFASKENSTYDGPTLSTFTAGYTYTVAYDINGGTGTLPSPGSYTDGSGTSYTVLAPSSVTPPSGKLFAGWNTKADGTGTTYDAGDSYSTARSVTLYAQWTNLLINLDGTNTESLPNDATSWSSVYAGNSRAVGSKVGGATYFSEDGIRGFRFDAESPTRAVEFPAGTGALDGEMTMETWVNIGDFDDRWWNIIATRWFTSSSGAGAQDWHFAIKPDSDNKYKLNLFTTDTADVFGEYEFPATSADVWYHLAFTIDSSDVGQLYVNGQPDGSSFTAYRTRNDNARLWLGDARDGMGFVGDMSAFRIYNKALSASEMSDSFDADKARFGLVELTFDPNGGSGSMSSQDVYENVSTTLNSNSFSRSGYLFDGWNTAADGTTGSDYSDGASIVAASDLTLYAKWVPDAYVMTFAKGSALGANGSNQTESKAHGVTYTLPNSSFANTNFTRTGYSVTGWSTDEAGSTKDYEFGDAYAADAVETFYPYWTINTYTLTLNKGTTSGAAGSNQTATKTHGVNYALPGSAYANATFTRAGHTVTGWSTTAAGLVKNYDFGDSFTTDANTTLYPYWTADTYMVTYSAGDDGSGSDVTGTKTYGTDLTLRSSVDANSDFTRTHYTVSAWSENSDGSTSDYALGGTYSTNEALTLYPVWTANTYTITYNYNGATGGNSTPTSSYVYGGIVVSLPTPTKTGYTFGGWYSDDTTFTNSVGGAGESYAPSGDIPIYAKWTATTFTVLYEYNGANGGETPDSDTYTTDGTVITLPIPTKTGYVFEGWYSTSGLTGSVGDGGDDFTTSINRTVYAKWTAIVRSVTYHDTISSGGVDTEATGGLVPTDSLEYTIGQSVVVKANSGSLALNGYTFEGWVTSEDGTGTALSAGETIEVGTSDIDLYPKWSANTYSITYNKNGGTGDLSSAPSSWQTGAGNVTLPNSGLSKTGFTFDGWQELGSTTKESYSYFPNYEDVTLVARWTVKSIAYQFDEGAASGLTITGWPSDSAANFGSSISLPDLSGTTVTISGKSYLFVGWDDGTTSYNPSDSYRMTETSPTFTAQWAELFDVRYVFGGGTHSVSGNGASECDTGGLCLDGEEITLRSAPERAGYTFTGWEDQSGDPFDAGETVNISASSYLFYAQWEAITYRFSFNTAGGNTTPPRQDKTIGEIVTMPSTAPSKNGYTFAGWSPDLGTTIFDAGAQYVVGTEPKSFVAQWIPDVYTVTYDWQGGASSAPKVSDSYTYGYGDMTLPTASAHGYTRDGYTFSGWSETVDGDLVTGFQPSANDVLYAVWADGNYTLSYNPSGGTVGSGTGTVPRTSSITLPTPVRDSFTFVGWYDAASGGTKLGDGGASYTPSASETLYARWVQDSLYGVDLATLESGSTITASNSGARSANLEHELSGSDATVSVPAGALPDGTVVTVRYFKDTNRQSDLISDENSYVFALLVSWLYGSGNSATVPNTASGKPITVTLTSDDIQAGSMVYQVIGESVTELGRAEVDGSVTVELTEDPELVVAATKPEAPTGVAGTSADSAASVSWTAATSGGAPVTKYTVTASPGGGTCETATTSCSISGLTNNTAYTFSVTATNAIGTSASSSASSAVTPRGTTYTVTFNSNGGSSISAGSFFSGGSVSSPSNPSRSGYTFQGWSTTQDDDSTEVTFPYSPGVLNAITLYALWDVAPASSNSSNRTTVVAPVTPAIPTLPNLKILPRPTVLIPAPLKAPVIIPSAPPVAGNETSVAVGGRSVASETLQEGDVVKVKTGKIEVGLSVPKPSPTTTVRPNPTTASPEVVVGVADVARLDAKGLLPGSSVQVWLPGAEGRELARSVVSADGSIAADIPLTATRDQAPVPIGPQVLQVTGVDEQGNQTVIDMTINVVQGAPAPEFNRVENALPDMQPGQSLATSAGVPEVVTISGNSETRQVSISSADWSFNVSVPESNGTVDATDEAAPTIRLIQSRSAEVNGDGFQPGTRVDIFLFSEPTLLGSFTVNADGSFTAEVFMDQRFAVVGDHTLQIQGVGTDGYVKAANLGVLVDEPLAVTTASDALGMLWWGIAAFSALLLLIVVVVAARRGRRLA